MDIDEVRDLIQLMVDNDLAELEVQDGEKRVSLKRRGDQAQLPEVVVAPPAAAAGLRGPTPDARQPSAADMEASDQEQAGLVAIRSPMVGTFYLAPDPESPPFVQVGSEIKPETVVCVIEAMKVYNEIKAEMAGVIERVTVQNEEAVEFGQTLFLVRPALAE